MKGPDLDRVRSEQKRSLSEFLTLYNAGLPAQFPRASAALLEQFKSAFPTLFKADGLWSLDQHRKKIMDWLPAHIKSLEPRLTK